MIDLKNKKSCSKPTTTMVCSRCRTPFHEDEKFFENKPLIGPMCEKCQKEIQIGIGSIFNVDIDRGRTLKGNYRSHNCHSPWAPWKRKSRSTSRPVTTAY